MFASLTFGGAIILGVVIWYFRTAIKSVADTADSSVQNLSKGVRKYSAYYAAQMVADANIETAKLKKTMETAEQYDPEKLLAEIA